MTAISELLFECDSQAIRLVLVGDGRLTIDAPEDALTPELIERLKAHKGALLAMLGPSPEVAPVPPAATTDDRTEAAKPVCRCGATTWREVPIHNGNSVRRDCSRCGRFRDFPVWHGRSALHNAK